MSLGRIAGGRAELTGGYPVTEIALAEGVESALSAWRLLGIPAWATCGGFPPSLPLPKTCRRVVLVADHDEDGGSERKARLLAASIRETGASCTVIMPQAVGTDANDVAKAAC
ncbi:MAG: toprim domain-containing protein [Defluviicoccus sp.]|nr:MAG: toprim domain-containing protein [Defluviicoccus sp.]